MAGELEYALFTIDLYGWGARICFVLHRPACMAGELEYVLFSIDLYGWGVRIGSVFHRPVWLGSLNMRCFP